jgi:anti-sigma factor RsiW
MTCEQLVELVTDYLEEGLPPGRWSEVEAHLRLCPGCREYLDQMRRTIAELGDLPAPRLTPQARADLLTAFRSYCRGGDPPPTAA